MRRSVRLLLSSRPTTSIPPSNNPAHVGPTAFDFENNPYRSRTTWPPDFSKLPPTAKFAYERTFRRRSKLKWARPRWNKWLITAQNGAILGTLAFALLWMDWTSGGKQPEPQFISQVRIGWKNATAGWWSQVDKQKGKDEPKAD